jgi:hypothetical protein
MYSHITRICVGLYTKIQQAYIIANDLTLNVDATLDQNSGFIRGIEVSGGTNIIASNLVKVSKLNGDLSWINKPTHISHMYFDDAGVYDSFNNIVDMATGLPTTLSEYAAIHYGKAVVGHVQNNIVLNGPHAAIKSQSSTPEVVQIANNICFNNAENCGVENGNLAVNPLFLDTNNYVLADNSPAINAGYDVLSRSDLDKTRADIGIHGGPYGFTQYQVQRKNTSTNPYVYPIFQNVNATNAETIAVRALAISRLK